MISFPSWVRWALVLWVGSLIGCRQTPEPPARPFTQYDPPPAPDYSQPSAWASLPTQPDPADYTPPGVTPENQAQAPADVFFIHPTIYFSSEQWSAALSDTALNREVDQSTIKHQASVFNHSARVYAPRYRQMSYPGFFSPDTASERQALELAYQDVKAAFEYFLAHYHEGRPLIIASHSQGTAHGLRLMREYFDGKPLQDKLVAAYLVGWPFPADTFAHLPVCAEPSQTGCVMGWCSYQMGKLDPAHETFYRGSVVVNPISWRYDTLLTAKSQHDGFLKGDYRSIVPQKLQAQAHDGVLWVSKPLLIMPSPNYHIADYNLFWVDIRQNVAQRVAAYLARSEAASQR